MADEQRQAFCAHCQDLRRFARPGRGIGFWHVFHALMTFGSLGLWFLVWLIHMVGHEIAVGPLRCRDCGEPFWRPGAWWELSWWSGEAFAQRRQRRVERASAKAAQAEAARQATIDRLLGKREARREARRLANQWDTLPRSHGPGPD
jgi:hypothetical protein